MQGAHSSSAIAVCTTKGSLAPSDDVGVTSSRCRTLSNIWRPFWLRTVTYCTSGTQQLSKVALVLLLRANLQHLAPFLVAHRHTLHTVTNCTRGHSTGSGNQPWCCCSMQTYNIHVQAVLNTVPEALATILQCSHHLQKNPRASMLSYSEMFVGSKNRFQIYFLRYCGGQARATALTLAQAPKAQHPCDQRDLPEGELSCLCSCMGPPATHKTWPSLKQHPTAVCTRRRASQAYTIERS